MPYYYKVNGKEVGPYEERVIIARLIDGEINSRTPIRNSLDTDYRGTIADSDFCAVLGSLTKRWRYNIGALKRETFYLYCALACWLLPPIFYWLTRRFDLAIPFDHARRYMIILSLAGMAATLYFTWMFAYRVWRVVPKTKYHITPGWRIMLTLIPFFRLGWNFEMWVPLASKLRALTNYTMYTGRGAAIFYSVSNIVLTLTLWALAILPWGWHMLTQPDQTPLWEQLLGLLLLTLALVSALLTLGSFLRMVFKMKKAALAILRHRYAYNVPMRECESPFMLQVLQRQRHRDAVRRWGHGIGIAGVLIGWPLLLIGVPFLVLLIVGSCQYSQTQQAAQKAGFATKLTQLYDNAAMVDNAGEKVREFHEALKSLPPAELVRIQNGDYSSSPELAKLADEILNYRNLRFSTDWENGVKAGFFEAFPLRVLAQAEYAQAQQAVAEKNVPEVRKRLARLAKIRDWTLKEPLLFYQKMALDTDKLYLDVLTQLLESSDLSQEDLNLFLDKYETFREAFLRNTPQAFYTEALLVDNLFRDQSFDVWQNFYPAGYPELLWPYLYAKTPFIYFSLDTYTSLLRQIAAESIKDEDLANDKPLKQYQQLGFPFTNLLQPLGQTIQQINDHKLKRRAVKTQITNKLIQLKNNDK